jgi:hypothetical protein
MREGKMPSPNVLAFKRKPRKLSQLEPLIRKAGKDYGLLLAEAKGALFIERPKTPWYKYVEETFGLGREYADELIRKATGNTTEADERRDEWRPKIGGHGPGSAEIPQKNQPFEVSPRPPVRTQAPAHVETPKQDWAPGYKEYVRTKDLTTHPLFLNTKQDDRCYLGHSIPMPFGHDGEILRTIHELESMTFSSLKLTVEA